MDAPPRYQTLERVVDYETILFVSLPCGPAKLQIMDGTATVTDKGKLATAVDDALQDLEIVLPGTTASSPVVVGAAASGCSTSHVKSSHTIEDLCEVIEDSKRSLKLLEKIVSMLVSEAGGAEEAVQVFKDSSSSSTFACSSWRDAVHRLNLPSWTAPIDDDEAATDDGEGVADVGSIARLEILFYLVTRLQQVRLLQQHQTPPKPKPSTSSSSTAKKQQEGGGVDEFFDTEVLPLLQRQNGKPENLSESQRRLIHQCYAAMQDDYERRKQSMRQRFEILKATFGAESSPSSTLAKASGDVSEPPDTDTDKKLDLAAGLHEHFTRPHSSTPKPLVNKKVGTTNEGGTGATSCPPDPNGAVAVPEGTSGLAGGGSVTGNESRMPPMPEWSNEERQEHSPRRGQQQHTNKIRTDVSPNKSNKNDDNAKKKSNPGGRNSKKK